MAAKGQSDEAPHELASLETELVVSLGSFRRDLESFALNAINAPSISG